MQVQYPQQRSPPITVSNNDYLKTGYNFAGWNTAADGSGTSYAEGDPYNITSNVTLYAQWTIANGVSVSGTLSAFSACAGSFSASQTLLLVVVIGYREP